MARTIKTTRKATPRKKMPPKFIVTDLRGQHYGSGLSETNAIEYGSRQLQQRSSYHNLEPVGIYRLIKVLRPKTTPVEVEEVSCCEDMK